MPVKVEGTSQVSLYVTLAIYSLPWAQNSTHGGPHISFPKVKLILMKYAICWILVTSLVTSAQDPINFDADPDPDPGSALKKMDPDPDPDPGYFFKIFCPNFFAYFYAKS